MKIGEFSYFPEIDFPEALCPENVAANLAPS